jgi:transposase InsO family protein
MSTSRLVITAVIVQKRPVAEVVTEYGVSRSWVYELLARYRAEGEDAFEPRSRRPRRSPRATPAATVELVLRLRKELTQAGLDAGADTISWHLSHHHGAALARATINRILTRHGAITPEPSKRPKASYLRFQADQPNETWQSDVTHYRLSTPQDTPGADTEIITWLDDHSRYALHITAHPRVTGPIVLTTFRHTVARHGTPASVLTDNGTIYTTRLVAGGAGRNGLETELFRLGITQKNSRPNHPTTCGKVERFQQTMKKWLRAQPVQPVTLTALQVLLDQFRDDYNTRRPHRSLTHRSTPAVAYTTRPKATPDPSPTGNHDRVRHDRISSNGTVTLRLAGRLHHIGIGRTHAGTDIILLVRDLHVRVVNAATGELLRDLLINPNRTYHGTGRPPGPVPKQDGRTHRT